MRIAMVGHKRVPSREGGIEVVVEELAARMVMHGHSVTCYNRTGHHVSGKEYDIEECYNVIHDNGIVFRKGDVDDLAQKLIYALEHPNAVRMFKWLAAEYVCTRFPWDKIVVETLKLYQK